jgi:hypothetical protein
VPAHLKSHSHLDVRIELAEDRDHPVEREAAKLRITERENSECATPVSLSASRVESLR